MDHLDLDWVEASLDFAAQLYVSHDGDQPTLAFDPLALLPDLLKFNAEVACSSCSFNFLHPPHQSSMPTRLKHPTQDDIGRHTPPRQSLLCSLKGHKKGGRNRPRCCHLWANH